MNFIGLLLVALALFGNLKAYPNVFVGKKKRAEAEKKLKEVWEKVDETPLAGKVGNGVIGVSVGISTFLNFLFYLITSIVVNNPIMYALAVVIFLLDIVINKHGMKTIVERKFMPSKANKLALPLKTLYIIGFFILFFL